MNFTGRVTKINHTTQVSEKYSKRTFVVTDGAASYPQFVEFTLSQKNCDLLDSINVGDEIEITFNLKGRNWTNTQGEEKTFNTLDAFRIKKVTSGSSSAPYDGSEPGDLPF